MSAVHHTKILLVDDLKENLLALDALLKRKDVEIFKAKSGAEALDFMITHEFALALIDVHMPEMSGFELAELMRGVNKTKNIPIIFVTATAKDHWSLFKGYESGAVDFLSKPLDTHAVKSKVNIFVELYQQKKELELLLAKLTTTQAELEQAVHIRDEFMSIASHELKTPLTAMSLQSQMRMRLLKKGDLSVFTPERLTKIFTDDLRQVRNLTQLVDDMLDISRIDSGKLSINLERFDLCDLVRDLVERSSEQLAAAGCPITIDVCAHAIGNWDHFRLEQVIVNLLSNAMRYGPGKAIAIEVRETKDGAQFAVRDQGPGIAKEHHHRIFEKYERAVPENAIGGLGLGLYIVKEILESHNGSVRVESDLGFGAAFVVELPSNELLTTNA